MYRWLLHANFLFQVVFHMEFCLITASIILVFFFLLFFFHIPFAHSQQLVSIYSAKVWKSSSKNQSWTGRPRLLGDLLTLGFDHTRLVCKKGWCSSVCSTLHFLDVAPQKSSWDACSLTTLDQSKSSPTSETLGPSGADHQMWAPVLRFCGLWDDDRVAHWNCSAPRFLKRVN